MAKRNYRPLVSVKALQKTMGRYYAITNYHRYWGKPLRRPLAWVTSGAPVELLRAFKIHSAYPEQYAAIYSARKTTVALCEIAEAAGYSQDLCSYARSNIGGVLRPDLAPLGGMPKPDLLVACNTICATVIKAHVLFPIPIVVDGQSSKLPVLQWRAWLRLILKFSSTDPPSFEPIS